MKQPIIAVSHLTVRSDDQLLLDNVTLEIYEGEITLLVGRSGSGKTVFMKILAGLITPANTHFKISGSIKVGGKEILGATLLPNRQATPIGIVFQDYGLMDNYSIAQNFDFAFAHSPFHIPREQRQNVAARLQQKLGLDYRLPIRHASGGQKRRIAIARTLAYNPEIIIYDEPTAGLDPQMMRTVASLIHDTHAAFSKKSSIVVTHQYVDFLPFANRVLFLDPAQKTISEVSPANLEQQLSREESPTSAPPKSKWWCDLGGQVTTFFAKTAGWAWRSVVLVMTLLVRLIPYWRSPLWGLRYFGHYLRLVSFFSAIFYIGMAGIIVGFVGAYFTFKFMPYAQYTRPLITEDVLSALGYGLYRIIIPISVSVLVAARCGAAVTSDLGNRIYLQEIDAMQSLGASPSRYLQTGVVYAFLIGMPVLTLIAFFLARLMCLWVFLFMHPQHNAIFADAIFHSFLRQGGELFFKGSSWVICKALVCGFGIGNICYLIGMRPKSSTRDISRDITLSVIWGTLFVLMTHLVFALLEF